MDYRERERKIKDMMGLAGIRQLNRLCSEHREIFSPDSSPDAEQLQVFYLLFNQTSYVTGLFEFGKLREAIDALEKGYVFYKQKCHPEKHPTYPALKRQEREVRFVRCLATILGSFENPNKYLRRGEQLKLRKKVVKRFDEDTKLLERLLDDEFFSRSLPGSEFHDLRQLLGKLHDAAQWISTAPVEYPVVRDRGDDSANFRYVATQMSYYCYRIYANCDVNIIRMLTSYGWLECIREDRLIKSLIQKELDIKSDQYQRREPIDGYDDEYWDPCGWLPPAYTLHPPWMNDDLQGLAETNNHVHNDSL